MLANRETVIAEREHCEVRWLDSDESGAWESSLLHEHFDRLSGTIAHSRLRNDLISDEIFDRLKANIDDSIFDDVLTLRNKAVAHAADTFSRSQAGTLRTGLKLDEFARAHRLLLGAMQAISAGILYGFWRASAVPVAQSDQFRGLAGQFVAEQRLPDLQTFWLEHCRERDEWLVSAYNEIIPKAP
jgi:hypothetical protein